MADNILQCVSSTLVTGVTSSLDYLVVNINNKNVGIPLFQFSQSTPDLDFVDLLKLEFKVNDGKVKEGSQKELSDDVLKEID